MIFSDTPAREYGRVVKFIEETLRELGHDPDGSRESAGEDQTRFRIQRGSAVVFIAVIRQARENILRLVAPILHGAGVTDHAALHRHLLELNLSALYQCAFAIDAAGDVVVTSDRVCRDLDRGEVKSLVDVLAYFADHYDDRLVEQFGGARWSD